MAANQLKTEELFLLCL